MSYGIVSYGVKVPFYRIKAEEINKVWLSLPHRGLPTREKGVILHDEDAITLAHDAAKRALEMTNLSRESVGALILGTQTSPYLSRASASIVLEMLGLGPDVFCGDCQFSGKSGTLAIQFVSALIKANMINFGIAVGADTVSSHTSPGDPQEFSASAGAGAIVLGNQNLIAEIEDTCSYSTDTPDYFRLDGERYIRTGGAAMINTDVGLPSHIRNAVKNLFERVNRKPTDFQYAVFQQRNNRIPYDLGRSLGFSREQIAPGMVVDEIGNCEAASCLIGLAKVLDLAKPGDQILVASYGFGGGSDAFCLKVTEGILKVNREPKVEDLLKQKEYVDYGTYIKFERKYDRPSRLVATFE